MLNARPRILTPAAVEYVFVANDGACANAYGDIAKSFFIARPIKVESREI